MDRLGSDVQEKKDQSLKLIDRYPPIVNNDGLEPTEVGVDGRTNRIYFLNVGSPSVSVIDGLPDTVISQVPVGSGPGTPLPEMYLQNEHPRRRPPGVFILMKTTLSNLLEPSRHLR